MISKSPQVTKKPQELAYFYQYRLLTLSFIDCYRPFPLVQNTYLSAGVATRRATKISPNMYLSYMKNVCELAYF